MARRTTHDLPNIAHDDASASREPRFDLFSSGIQQRAAQWSAVGETLAASLASHPEQHAPVEDHSRPARASVTRRQPQSLPSSARRGTPKSSGGNSPGQTNESWQLRQIELLERIDENIRRLRELQESSRPPQSAFTDPAY